MTQFRMSAAMRMKIGDLSVGNARGWGGLGRAFTRALARDMTRDRQTDRHPHRFMIWPHVVGHMINTDCNCRVRDKNEI